MNSVISEVKVEQQLSEQILELMGKLNEYDALIKAQAAEIEQYKEKDTSVSKKQIEKSMNTIRSLRAQIRVYQERLASLREDIKELKRRESVKKYEKDVAALNARIEGSTAQYERDIDILNTKINNAEQKLDSVQKSLEIFLIDTMIYPYIFEKIIFPKFQKDYDVLKDEKASSVNQYRMFKAVKQAKKKDAYNEIVEQCSKETYDYLLRLSEYEIGKQKVDEFKQEFDQGIDEKAIVEEIIANKTERFVSDAIFKTSGGRTLLALAGVGVLAAIGGFTVSSVLGNDLKALGNDLNTSTSINKTSTTVNVKTLSAVEQTYKEIKTDLSQADTINSVWGVGATPETQAIVSTLVDHDVETDKLMVGYNMVTEAATAADKIMQADANGISAFSQTKAAYETAVANNQAKEAEAQAKKLNGYIEIIKNCKANSTDGLTAMIEASGATTAELQQIVELLRNPTASVTFDAATVKTYAKNLLNPTKGGKPAQVLSNTYDRQTGDVTLFVECVDGRGQTYYNLLQYRIDANLTLVTPATLMEPLAKGKVTASVTSYDKDLVSSYTGSAVTMNTVSGQQVSGTSELKYSTLATYNEKSDTTKVTAQAVMIVKDADGNIAGINTVTVTKNYTGKVKSADVEETLKTELLSQINQICVNAEEAYILD